MMTDIPLMAMGRVVMAFPASSGTMATMAGYQGDALRTLTRKTSIVGAPGRYPGTTPPFCCSCPFPSGRVAECDEEEEVHEDIDGGLADYRVIQSIPEAALLRGEMVEGSERIDWAKMMGITPAMAEHQVQRITDLWHRHPGFRLTHPPKNLAASVIAYFPSPLPQTDVSPGVR